MIVQNNREISTRIEGSTTGLAYRIHSESATLATLKAPTCANSQATIVAMIEGSTSRGTRRRAL